MKTITLSDDAYTMLRAIIISDHVDGNSWSRKELKKLDKLLVLNDIQKHIRTRGSLTNAVFEVEE